MVHITIHGRNIWRESVKSSMHTLTFNGLRRSDSTFRLRGMIYLLHLLFAHTNGRGDLAANVRGRRECG